MSGPTVQQLIRSPPQYNAGGKAFNISIVTGALISFDG